MKPTKTTTSSPERRTPTCRQRLQTWPEIPVTWERRDPLVAFITDAGHV